MKYGYLIAYTDETKELWTYPSHPMRKKDILREYNFMNRMVKPEQCIIFKVDKNNIPEEITWDFVYENKLSV